MEITEEQLRTIEEQIRQGVISKNVIIPKIINDDRIFDIISDYRDGKTTIDIAAKRKMTINEVMEIKKYVENLYRIIDSKISEKYRISKNTGKAQESESEEDINNKSSSEDRINNIKNKTKADKIKYLTNEIDLYIKKYRNAKLEKNIKRMRPEKNSELLKKKIELLERLTGKNQISYRLFLISLYIDIEYYDKAEDLIDDFNYMEVKSKDKEKAEKLKIDIIDGRNIADIKRLHRKGKTYEQILKECDRFDSERRVRLSISQIGRIIRECEEEDKEL